MRPYYTIKRFRIFNAPVSVHWSALLVIGIILVTGYKEPIHAVIAAASYFSILLIHEIGHGFVANKLGYKVFETKIAFFHGMCIFKEPYNEEHHIKIAWAGSLAQIFVAIPLIVLSQFKVVSDISYLGPVYAFLGYLSVLVALVNLAPSQGLDGHIAWRIIPLTYRKWRNKPKKKKKKFNVVK